MKQPGSYRKVDQDLVVIELRAGFVINASPSSTSWSMTGNIYENRIFQSKRGKYRPAYFFKQNKEIICEKVLAPGPPAAET
jgi:hypothetical protein